MAKTAIVRVGVEADPSGLGSVRGQITRGVNSMAAQFGTIRGAMTAAMALPAVQMLETMLDARKEAREMAKELMMPMSAALQSAESYKIQRRMEAGSAMVGLGLDTALARGEQRQAEVDIAKGLQATEAGAFEKAIGMYFTKDFWAQIPNVLGSTIGSISEDVKGLAGYGDVDQKELSLLQFSQALSLMTGDTGQLYAINQQMLRVMEKIEQKTRQP